MVPGTEAQVKVNTFTIQFLLACSHRNEKDQKLWPVVVGFSWRNVMTWESSSIQDATRKEGRLGWRQAHETAFTPVWGQELALFRGRHVTLSVTDSTAVDINWYKWIWVRISYGSYWKMHIFSLHSKYVFTILGAIQNGDFYSNPMLLTQVVHGPQFKKHCSDRNLEDMIYKRGFPGDSVVKNLPVMQKMQKTQFRSMSWKDPLEEGMQPTAVFFPGEPNGQYRLSLAVYSP